MMRIVLLVLALFFALPAYAAQTIDMPVTIKASKPSAQEAKAQALAEGERQAIYAALDKLAPTQSRVLYRTIQGTDLSRFVVAFTITRSVSKAGYYEADILYRLDKTKLVALIGENQGIAATPAGDPTGHGLLILPAYETAGSKLMLFEPENLWRAILNNVALEVGQGTLVLPFGDKADKAALDNAALLAGSKEIFSRLATRYGTRNVVIVTAKTQEKNGVNSVEVRLRKPGADAQQDIVLPYVASSPTETLDLLLARAAREVSLKLRASAENYSLFSTSEDQKLKLLVLRADYAQGSQWRTMLALLQALPGLDHLTVDAVGANHAKVSLYYRGESTLLERSLLAHNMVVEKRETFWVMKQ